MARQASLHPRVDKAAAGEGAVGRRASRHRHVTCVAATFQDGAKSSSGFTVPNIAPTQGAAVVRRHPVTGGRRHGKELPRRRTPAQRCSPRSDVPTPAERQHPALMAGCGTSFLGPRLAATVSGRLATNEEPCCPAFVNAALQNIACRQTICRLRCAPQQCGPWPRCLLSWTFPP
jgi:hypothetical protein